MSAPLIIAIPSKGRLQDNTSAFFERAGLVVERPGGARNYRGQFRGVDNIEIAFLSASEISSELAAGAVHLGITGLDLVHEKMPDRSDRDANIHAILPLGFGYADVVLAVPDKWIDVETMSDLTDVALDFRTNHKARLRIATKYVNLANAFFAEKGFTDYRIVDSLGATEGAPAAGAAEVIIDITTTGSTLRANDLRVLRDGVILKSEAHLMAAKTAHWSETALKAAQEMLLRVEAEKTARGLKLLTIAGPLDEGLKTTLETEHSCRFPFDAVGGGAMLLHCPKNALFDVVNTLRDNGVADIAVSHPDYVFTPGDSLFEALKGVVPTSG